MPFDSEIGSVKLYSPSAPGKPWRVTWTPPGMTRQVKDRKTKAGAEKLAKEIKRQLKRGEIGQVHRATTEEQQLLEICRKLRDPKAILQEALDRQGNFKRATVAACCDLYIAKLLYHIKHHGYSLQQIEPREIEDCPASYFIQDISFVDLRRTAAYELFELYYPEEYRVWEKSTCDGLSFDVDHFLDSPAFSTAEFKIGEERILVVEPL